MKKSMPPPFPQALKGKKKASNQTEILEVLRQVNDNIPLLYMIKQVPTYAKFLKDLCTVKRWLGIDKKAILTEQVNASRTKKKKKKKTKTRRKENKNIRGTRNQCQCTSGFQTGKLQEVGVLSYYGYCLSKGHSMAKSFSPHGGASSPTVLIKLLMI